MAALMVGIAVMGIMAAVALPVISQSVQRDKEAELIFRGEQYARAVGLFQRKMGPGTLPPNLDVLVDQKFLRRKYKDPITGKDFRPLSAAEAQGTGLGRGGAAIPGMDPRAGGRSGAFQGAPGTAGLGGVPAGMSGGLGAGLQGGGLQGGGLQGGGLQGGGLQGGGLQGGGLPGGGLGAGGMQGGQPGGGLPQGVGGPGRATTGGTGQPMGGIIGVISTSSKTAIRRYNDRDKYSEWAFVYNAPTQVAGGAAGAGGAGGAAGGIGPGMQGAPGGVGPGLQGVPGARPPGQMPAGSSPMGGGSRIGPSTPLTPPVTNPRASGR